MYFIALQSDGSRLRYEWWVVDAYLHGILTDPMLLKGLVSAVSIYRG